LDLVEAGALRRRRIGVLALQGDFSAHARALERAGAEVAEVRSPAALRGLDGLVIPGGESTALLRLMRPERMDEAVTEFHGNGGALFGTCAGLIVLAAQVERPGQESLGLIDLAVERNAYGRQVDSFVGLGRVHLNGGADVPVEMVFIRAPRILRVAAGVEVLGWLGDEPVLARQDRILVSTFHPEMSAENRIHRYFLDSVVGRDVRLHP
jgi:pyridoxal 5'-phosphate synthase pdxT subunit